MKMTFINKIRNALAVALVVAAAAGVSCSRDAEGRDGDGAIALSMTIDSKLYEQTVTTRAVVDDYSVKIKDSKGNLVKSYASKAEIPAQIWLVAGEYTLSVAAGTNEEIALNKPYYTGMKKITITPNEVASIDVVCTLANAAVAVSYSDRVKTNFSGMSTVVKNSKGSMSFAGETASQKGYVKITPSEANSVDWSVSLTNTSTGKTFTESGQITDMQASTCYTLSFDIDADYADGGLVFKLVVDTDVKSVDVTHDIILKARPEIKGVSKDGLFDLAKQFVIVNKVAPDKVGVDIKATPQISTVWVEHTCKQLTDAGIPLKFNMMAVSDDNVQKLHRVGFTWTQPEKDHLVVDLTTLGATLSEAGTGNTTFTFDVTDSYGKKRTETFNIVVTDAVVLTLPTRHVLADIWTTKGALYGQWLTDARPDGLTFDFGRKEGTLVELTPNSTALIDGKTIKTGAIEVVDAAEKIFRMEVTGLDPQIEYAYCARANVGPSNVYQSFVTDDAKQLSNLNFDTWSGNTPGKDWGTANSSVLGVTVTVTQSTDDAVQGKAARLPSSQKLNIFAAGNVFTGGNFSVVGTSGGEMDFGVPFTGRPTSLSFYYKYTCGSVDFPKSPYMTSGQNDIGSVYILLTDWNKPFHVNTASGTLIDFDDAAIIAIARWETNQSTSEYQKITIPLTYRDKTRRPKYALIVASASKYGDYFCGSTGSVMQVDEFSLGYDD